MEEAKEGRGSMVDLPHEMLLTIFFKLPLTDVVSCLFVCYKWSVLATDDTLWKPFFVEKWPEERLTEDTYYYACVRRYSDLCRGDALEDWNWPLRDEYLLSPSFANIASTKRTDYSEPEVYEFTETLDDSFQLAWEKCVGKESQPVIQSPRLKATLVQLPVLAIEVHDHLEEVKERFLNPPSGVIPYREWRELLTEERRDVTVYQNEEEIEGERVPYVYFTGTQFGGTYYPLQVNFVVYKVRKDIYAREWDRLFRRLRARVKCERHQQLWCPVCAVLQGRTTEESDRRKNRIEKMQDVRFQGEGKGNYFVQQSMTQKKKRRRHRRTRKVNE